MALRQEIEGEALAAREAASRLTDERVEDALAAAAAILRERRAVVLAANAADVEAVAGRLGMRAGALSRSHA